MKHCWLLLAHLSGSNSINVDISNESSLLLEVSSLFPNYVSLKDVPLKVMLERNSFLFLRMRVCHQHESIEKRTEENLKELQHFNRVHPC